MPKVDPLKNRRVPTDNLTCRVQKCITPQETYFENVNAEVDDLIATGVLRRVLAFTELKFSNSTIEAWWRSLKHQWLFLHSLDSVATVRRLVAFYVDEHNRVLPHSAFRGQTPDEMYFGTGDAVPAELAARAAAARRTRVEANHSASCRPARQSMRPRDHGVLTAVPITGTSRARTPGGEGGRTRDRTSPQPMRRTVSGIGVDCP